MATKKKTTKKDALATQEPAGLPAEFGGYGEDEASGYENQTSDDVGIGFLVVLQAQSPQVEDRDDCQAGMLFDTVTEEVFAPGEVYLVPVLTQHEYDEWKPRDVGGGLLDRHAPDSDVVAKAKQEHDFGKYKTDAGNDLVETFKATCLLVRAEGFTPIRPIMLSFKSTAIKPYKRWMTRMRTFVLELPDGAGGTKYQKPPMFANVSCVDTVKQSNSQGSWYNIKVDPAVDDDIKKSLIPPSHPAYGAAKGVKSLVSAGKMKVNYDSQQKAAGSGESDDEAF